MWSMWTLFYFALQKLSLRSLGGHPAALARGLARLLRARDPHALVREDVPDPSRTSHLAAGRRLLRAGGPLHQEASLK